MDHRYRKFLAVADTGSFSAAAKKLHVTQPAITLAVASLEREFGTKLYIRKKYAVELTTDGMAVARTAKKLALEVEKLQVTLGQEPTASGRQIGIIDSIAHLLYASSKESTLLNNIEVMVDNSRRIISEILADKIDAGLITGQPSALSKDIAVQKLHNEEFVFVCAPYLAPVGAVTQIDDWLAFNQDSTSFRHFTKQCKRLGLRVTPVFYSTSIQLLKEMAVAGKGTALLPRHLVQESVHSGTLEIVKTKPLYRPIWVIMRKEHQSTVMRNLSARVDNLLNARYV
ncbi:MAG TPA: LysR family transcriptional regulator [Patescibacteria group bacterium]|nr:LysR family transcriptional regulator [Patescibacteria group bacterium]